MPELIQASIQKDKEATYSIHNQINPMDVQKSVSPFIWIRRMIRKFIQITFWFLTFSILSVYASSFFLAHDSISFTNWIRGGGEKQQQHSSSLFQVDPNSIMTTIIKYGGLKLLPPSLEQDLKTLEKVCSSDLSSLDIIYKEMEFRNLTLSVNKEKGVALKVGRLWLKWNSYHKPCLDIELEDVDIFVEFTNLMLTKTNW